MRYSVSILICFVLIALFAPAMLPGAAAQLSDDQEQLLQDIRRAFEARDTWDSYSQSQNETVNSALTVTGADSARWQTSTLTRQSIIDYDLDAKAASGTVTFQRNLADSDNQRDSSRDQIAFIAVDNTVYVASDGSDFAEVASDDYADFRLEALTTFSKDNHLNIPTDLLDHAIEVFDLGVSRDKTQRYQVALDFAASVPELDFNLDAFVSSFNGIVELGNLTSAIIESSTLTLNVSTDAETGALQTLTLVLEIPVQIEGEAVVAVDSGSGIFELAYSQQQAVTYFNVNEAFDITAP